jgi:uncharacterized membrane protein
MSVGMNNRVLADCIIAVIVVSLIIGYGVSFLPMQIGIVVWGVLGVVLTFVHRYITK